MGYAKVAIVELNLHVDDMRDASLRNFDHLKFVPDTSPNRNAVGHPGHVHHSSLQYASRIASMPFTGVIRLPVESSHPAQFCCAQQIGLENSTIAHRCDLFRYVK